MKKFTIKFNQKTNFFWTNNIFLATEENTLAEKLLYAIDVKVNVKENIVSFTFSNSNNESGHKKLTLVEGGYSTNERMYYSFALLRKGEQSQSLKGTGIDKLLKSKKEDQICFTNFVYSVNDKGDLVCTPSEIFINKK